MNLTSNSNNTTSTISTTIHPSQEMKTNTKNNTKNKKNKNPSGTTNKTKSLKQILLSSSHDQQTLVPHQQEKEIQENPIFEHNPLHNFDTMIELHDQQTLVPHQQEKEIQENPRFEHNPLHNFDTMIELHDQQTLVPHQQEKEKQENPIFEHNPLHNFDTMIDQHKPKRPKLNQSGGGGGASGGGGGGGGGGHRRLWVKDRSKAWWDTCNHPDFPETDFQKSFRMSRATFDMICEELSSAVAKENTMLRAAIPVRQRVAVCIWRLATGEPLRLVSKRFGLGISTCHKLVLEVCLAIKTVLMPKFLQWPDDQTLDKVKTEYELISGIPNVVGSMYTTHIPIIAPKISVSAYFNKRHTERNQKTSYSITVQGVVDHKGVFTDCCIGWPGSMLDDQILEKSALFQRANNGGLLKDGFWIVGSSGYPLTDWVLVPYTHQHLTWTQHAFNEKISEVQRVAKEAFTRLKRRWSCLQKRTEVKLQDLPVVLGACCVLHNICEMRNDEMDPELRFELMDDEVVPENSLRSATAMPARDNIAHNLLHRGLAGTTFL